MATFTPSAVSLAAILAPDMGESAFAKVRANRGAPGADRITIDQLIPVFPARWSRLAALVREGRYQPQPLRRVEIPKPSGGIRRLGIPAVMDRVLQQAIAQTLVPGYERVFSPRSYAYRPGREAIGAVRHIRDQANSTGKATALHLDIRDFFDSVPRSIVLSLLAEDGVDPSLVALIGTGLDAPVQASDSLVRASAAGLPQGSPLSPLLANRVLHELDLWLAERSVEFARYADDVLILLESRAAGQRLLFEIEETLHSMLGLELNREKTKLGPWSRAEFLGYRFFRDAAGAARLRVSPDSLAACSDQIGHLAANRAAPRDAADFWRGWLAYYRHTEKPGELRTLRERLVTRWPEAEFSEIPTLKTEVPGSNGRPRTRRSPLPGNRVAYDGALPRRDASPPPDAGSVLWFATLRQWISGLVRSRFVRFRIEFGAGRGHWLPRPRALGVWIAGHYFRIRL